MRWMGETTRHSIRSNRNDARDRQSEQRAAYGSAHTIDRILLLPLLFLFKNPLQTDRFGFSFVSSIDDMLMRVVRWEFFALLSAASKWAHPFMTYEQTRKWVKPAEGESINIMIARLYLVARVFIVGSHCCSCCYCFLHLFPPLSLSLPILLSMDFGQFGKFVSSRQSRQSICVHSIVGHSASSFLFLLVLSIVFHHIHTTTVYFALSIYWAFLL